jgi:hypothetical protein
MGIFHFPPLTYKIVTYPRTPSRDPFSSTPTSTVLPVSRSRRTDREASLQSLPPTPLGTGPTQAPQSTYIQTLTRQQIIASELFFLSLGMKLIIVLVWVMKDIVLKEFTSFHPLTIQIVHSSNK